MKIGDNKIVTINKWSLNIVVKSLISFSLLFIGGFIYLGWRSGNLVMFQLLDKYGFSEFLNSYRCLGTNYSIYDWIKYCMPDGLWLFSYMFLIDAIWDNHKCVSYYIFLWILPVIAIISELLQFIMIVPGTFDIMDLFCYLMAIIIFLILKNL